LTWTFDTGTVVAGPQQRAVLLNPLNPVRKLTEARVQRQMVLVRHGIPFFRNKKNLHLLDYNLFWYSIRRNVEAQVQIYLKTHGMMAGQQGSVKSGANGDGRR
jgi:hypothetical protein